jgi:hypothetical protein
VLLIALAKTDRIRVIADHNAFTVAYSAKLMLPATPASHMMEWPAAA